MSEEKTTLTPKEQELVDKYKTIARAVIANDPEGSFALKKAFDIVGGTLEKNDIDALGLRWLSNTKTERNFEMIDFLASINFDFNQFIVLDQKKERVGRPIPFCLLDSEEDHPTLMELLKRNIVTVDVMDGVGDSLLQSALAARHFDFAATLLSLGANVDQSNIAGQSALHYFAHKGDFCAVKWLCENGADPAKEDLKGQRPSEMVPESLPGGMDGDWDVECLYNLLEDYVVDFKNGNPFTTSEDFEKMVEREIQMFAPKEEGTPSEVDQGQADEFNNVVGKLTP